MARYVLNGRPKNLGEAKPFPHPEIVFMKEVFKH